MSDISDLEAEYELETDDEFEESDGEQSDDEHDSEEDEEIDTGQSYAERFAELAMREFETEEEIETGLRDVLGEMEKDLFFGKIFKKGLSLAKKVARKAAAKGLRYAAGQLPVAKLLKGATGILGKTVTNQLLQAAASAFPGAGLGISALQSLGVIPPGEGNGATAETWERFAEFAQEAYENAADLADETSMNPLAAMQQARSAIAGAARSMSAGLPRGEGHGSVRRHRGGRVVHVRPGESITIVCK